jgi:hypothetical protein
MPVAFGRPQARAMCAIFTVFQHRGIAGSRAACEDYVHI